jgi:hypothetical protein
VLEIDIRRMEEGYRFNGAGRRVVDFGGEEINFVLKEASASRFIECRDDGKQAVGEVLKMLTICGFPTTIKETTLAVSSCDFLLDERDDWRPRPSSPSDPSKSIKESS